MGHRLPTAGVFVIQREVVGRDERYLERAFGEEYLVHIQDRFRAMSYGNEHETSYLRTYAF